MFVVSVRDKLHVLLSYYLQSAERFLVGNMVLVRNLFLLTCNWPLCLYRVVVRCFIVCRNRKIKWPCETLKFTVFSQYSRKSILRMKASF